MRLIEATFSDEYSKRIMNVVEQAEPSYYHLFDVDESGTRLLKVFFGKDETQTFVDRLQAICEQGDDWRILVMPVAATAPALEKKPDNDKEKKRRVALREEIYADVAGGAALSRDYFILTLASTIVAAIGLNADNVAAVIGAMVIAPLLGPILAFAFGSALGDLELTFRAARTALAGLCVGVVSTALIGLLVPLNMDSVELMSRTVVGLDSIALGLAAGAAAALSITIGVSSALVGVMVAVALLPPAAAIGLFAGAGEFDLAGRAALLLTVNIICIMLSALGIFRYKDIRPRTWLERKSAKNAVRINFVILIVLLAAAAAFIFFAQTGVIPEEALAE